MKRRFAGCKLVDNNESSRFTTDYSAIDAEHKRIIFTKRSVLVRRPATQWQTQQLCDAACTMDYNQAF